MKKPLKHNESHEQNNEQSCQTNVKRNEQLSQFLQVLHPQLALLLINTMNIQKIQERATNWSYSAKEHQKLTKHRRPYFFTKTVFSQF